MVTIAGSLNPISEIWASLIVAAVWQSTLLALFIALVTSRLKQASPVIRYWLWQVVALKLLIIPFWTISIPLPTLFASSLAVKSAPPLPSPIANVLAYRPDRAASSVAPTEPAKGVLLPSEQTGLSTASYFMTAWLLIVAFQVFLVLRQRSAMVRLLRLTRPADDRALEAQLAELAHRLSLRRAPDVKLTELQGSPFVCGLLKPVLVLPVGLAGALAPGELRQVLLHELAHVKRGDLFWDWFPAIARMLFFFHPVAHWAAGRILLERELACDQAAMSLSNCDAGSYARMLLRVASTATFPLRAPAPAVNTGFESISDHRLNLDPPR
jgi:beta-lactamase regulating signal transducer with metallopeptidase domain